MAARSQQDWRDAGSHLRMLPRLDSPGTISMLCFFASTDPRCRLACSAASFIASLTSALSPSSDRRYRLSRQVGSSSSSPAQVQGVQCSPLRLGRSLVSRPCARLTAVMHPPTLLAHRNRDSLQTRTCQRGSCPSTHAAYTKRIMLCELECYMSRADTSSLEQHGDVNRAPFGIGSVSSGRAAGARAVLRLAQPDDAFTAPRGSPSEEASGLAFGAPTMAAAAFAAATLKQLSSALSDATVGDASSEQSLRPRLGDATDGASSEQSLRPRLCRRAESSEACAPGATGRHFLMASHGRLQGQGLRLIARVSTRSRPGSGRQ